VVRIPQTVLSLLLVAPGALSASAQFQTHTVKAIPRAGRIVVDYAGMPVTVRLAQIALPESAEAEAKVCAAVAELLEGKKVRVAYCPEAGLDPDGLPQVYAIAGIKNVNEQLVRMGLARYDARDRRSPHYHQKMVSADAAARKAKAGMWAEGEGPVVLAGSAPARGSGGRPLADGVYSELNSSMYHLPTCRWAEQMSAQRRIRYKTSGAAERAGKKPCWICLAERAEGAMRAALAPDPRMVRVVRDKGPLVGHAGVFHAPNCEGILDKAADCTSYGTASEAKAKGLSPCKRCLRLSGQPVPLPMKGECSGRAPPHRRPCRRKVADESGLCSYCQGKGE
jgi:endonuclease YncB( thermonuclease family)